MNKVEINTFIEEMEAFGDVWEPADVERVYKGMTLEEALNNRRLEMYTFADIIGKVYNRKSTSE
ncbi:hypothetical protein [Flexilinea flocculi]|uniref:Uncharacterized protein n=1 Tax=Flexilinea flocculi TaxID=1678840 RepID=A0A0S7BLD5_9CHLR|nr:hypothetical protein [Flexilinea flocculi]NLI41269.1 hypothetical protein [Caldisericales bacterium]GAP41146.1 hypothetical protein ATC1_131128 [Flexilinea flocculi]